MQRVYSNLVSVALPHTSIRCCVKGKYFTSTNRELSPAIGSRMRYLVFCDNWCHGIHKYFGVQVQVEYSTGALVQIPNNGFGAVVSASILDIYQ